MSNDSEPSQTVQPAWLTVLTKYAPPLVAALYTTYDKIKHRRAQAFLKELEKGISTEQLQRLLESEDFVESFISFSEAALRTKRHGKILVLARMLIAFSSQTMPALSLDSTYYQKLVDDLELQEIAILFILMDFENRKPKNMGIHAYAEKIWREYEAEIEKRLKISPGLLHDMLTRLGGKGLVENEPALGGGHAYSHSNNLSRELESVCKMNIDEILSQS